jgi:hypothetical protein
MKPPSILDPKFKYVPSNNTDLKKTFARVRREMRLPEPAKPDPKIVPIIRRRGK